MNWFNPISKKRLIKTTGFSSYKLNFRDTFRYQISLPAGVLYKISRRRIGSCIREVYTEFQNTTGKVFITKRPVVKVFGVKNKVRWGHSGNETLLFHEIQYNRRMVLDFF